MHNLPPGGSEVEPRDRLRAGLACLGTVLADRVEDVVASAVGGIAEGDAPLSPSAEEDIARVVRVSTVAVGHWLSGTSIEVAREVGWEAFAIFGRLAAERTVSLDQLTKCCLRWRDAASELIAEEARRSEIDPAVLADARRMLQRSLDVTLVRMCQRFEVERKRMHDQLERHQAELTYSANHDFLTGLPNRQSFNNHLDEMLTSEGLHIGAALVLLDLDRFKDVNDSLGHSYGDRLLIAVAERLAKVVREPDLVARFGGDEFAVIVAAEVNRGTAEDIADRLGEALTAPFLIGGSLLRVQASIGIALCPEHGKQAELLLERADAAMYEAKRAGLRQAVYRP